MGFVNLNLGNLKEMKALPISRQRVTIASWEEGESREKRTPQYKIVINVDGHPDAMPINHYLSLPSPKDEPKSAEYKHLLIKRFLTLFGVPHTDEGFDPDDMIGASADVEVGLTEPNKNGETYNFIVVPKLKVGDDGPVAVDTQMKRSAGGSRKR